MKSIIKSAKTIDEAIELGIKELGLTRDKIEYEVIEEPSKGVFGIFGGNDAIVKIKEKKEMKIDLDEIFESSDLNTEPSEEVEEETLEDIKIDQELEERFKKYEENDEEEINQETDFVKKDEEVKEYIESEEDDDLYEKDDSNYDHSENKDEELDESEEENHDLYDNEFVQTFKSNPDLVVNTRELEFSGEVKKVTDDDSLEEVSEKVKRNLEDILTKLHIEAKVNYETYKDNIININLTDISENDTGIVIGSKGETLNAIQYILSLLTNKNTKEYYRVNINVGGYRDRRKNAIENNAKKVAYKVLKTKKSIALKPMNSYERRIVHYALQNYKEIETTSSGKFPNRKVVIKYKG